MSGILVPVDGSKIALRAVEHAAKQVKGRRTAIHLLNVEPEPVEYGMVRAYVSRKEHRAATKARADAILAPAAKLLEQAGVKHQVHVVYGEAPAAIVKAARRLECEAIVMGTRGLGAVGRILLGSVASRVVQLASVPVTLIR